MTPRTPITLITGPLGSGKTTLLRHILATKAAKIAIVMNEFGEIAIDADMLVRFPELGHTTRLQIEGADILLLNKIDLVDATEIEALEKKLYEINSTAAIVRTERCQIDPELLFGIGREKKVAHPRHK